MCMLFLYSGAYICISMEITENLTSAITTLENISNTTYRGVLFFLAHSISNVSPETRRERDRENITNYSTRSFPSLMALRSFISAIPCRESVIGRIQVVKKLDSKEEDPPQISTPQLRHDSEVGQ